MIGMQWLVTVLSKVFSNTLRNIHCCIQFINAIEKSVTFSICCNMYLNKSLPMDPDFSALSPVTKSHTHSLICSQIEKLYHYKSIPSSHRTLRHYYSQKLVSLIILIILWPNTTDGSAGTTEDESCLQATILKAYQEKEEEEACTWKRS